MKSAFVAVVAVVLIGGPFAIVFFGARRYEARQRRLGRWDKYGPLVESESPSGGWFGAMWPSRGRSMNERLEVIGAWKGRILLRRKPNESPAKSPMPPGVPREHDDL
jgi:hypothetical protein